MPAPAGAPPGANAGELVALAEELARTAGALVLAGRALAPPHDVDTKSSPTDVVTEWDRAAERTIVDGLRAARPGDGVIGEEGTVDGGTSGIAWFVDPIDGTTNFLYDLPTYSISIAATDAHGALAGVVFAPRLGELFAATRAGGATLDGRPIRVRVGATLATALVGTGFAYAPERRRAQGEMWARAIAGIRDLRRLGSAALDLCYVACGRYDAYVEHGLNPWDAAAGALVAAEAGARLGAIEGGPARPASVLVATPEVFAPLQHLLSAAGAAAVAQLYDR